MQVELKNADNNARDAQAADEIMNVVISLHGVSEALAYRAEAEDDDMLVLLTDVLEKQIDVLRGLARNVVPRRLGRADVLTVRPPE